MSHTPASGTLAIVACCLVAKSCLTLCDPRDYSPPGSSVQGISQAIILEWVAISFSRGSSWPRDWTQVGCIGRWILHHWATREAQSYGLHVCVVLQSLWNRRLSFTTSGLTATLLRDFLGLQQPSALNNRNTLSLSSGGWTLKSRELLGWFILRAVKGRVSSRLLYSPADAGDAVQSLGQEGPQGCKESDRAYPLNNNDNISLAWRWLSSSCVSSHRFSSMCISVQISFYEDTRHIGLGPTGMTSFWLDYLHTDPFSKGRNSEMLGFRNFDIWI